MIKNYLLTALRNLWRTRSFSFINILGLAIGISAAMVIYLIVHFDLSFDDFQPNRDRIYRVVTDENFSGVPYHIAGVPYPLPAAARKELVGLKEVVPLWTISPRVTIPGQPQPTTIKEQQYVTYTDAHYFQLFRFYTWLAGSAAGLDAPNHTVLTATRAATYFPGLRPEQVLGKTIVYGDSTNATVTGVVSDPPPNTDISFLEFVSIAMVHQTKLREYANAEDWNGILGTCQLLIELAPGIHPEAISRQLVQLQKKYNPEAADRAVYILQPLTDIHFNAVYDNFKQRVAHKPTLYGLMLVAAFLLTLACINFINLSTANASRRAKEIGIRKTFGGARHQLLFQFLGETFLLTLLSFGLSFVLTPWLLHVFADFIPPGLDTNLLHQPSFGPFLLGLLLGVTILAGFYPSWILSRFLPVEVLRNQVFSSSATTRSSMIRKTLTGFQFAIAQAFIIATLIVGRQLHYSLTADLGFKKDAIINFTVPYTWNSPDNKRFQLLDRIKTIPGVERAASGRTSPSTNEEEGGTLRYADGKKTIETNVELRDGDPDYRRIYHLPLLAGRDLRLSDTTAEFLINQTYCRLLGFKTPEEAIGKTLKDGDTPIPIAGVIADFHQTSLHAPIRPLALTCSRGKQFDLHIALQPQPPGTNAWHTTIGQIEKAFKSTYPAEDFTFQFYDETIAKYYTTEQQLSRLLQWATGLTILISCLGLAGLVVFTTNTRTKEIGIRKVLGAPVAAIITLLSKEFVNLLLIAFGIAAPAAWWAAHRWLETFAYRAPVSWWIFPLAGCAMLGIALLTMSIRTIRAATANPVDALRSE
jgi:putative ABC transport system permease protein